MSMKIIEDEIEKFKPKTEQGIENALKEVAYKIALSSLARTDFFRRAAFIGESCLRIFYGLPRFSEDLDFWALQAQKDFHWTPYLEAIVEEFKLYAFDPVIIDREKADQKIKRAFIKEDSVGKMLVLSPNFGYNIKLKIKFEIDTLPLQGGGYELKHLSFPYACSVASLDRPSLFASKIGALFDRDKGRHWYDFIYYVSGKWPLNFHLLKNVFGVPVTIMSLADKMSHLIRSKNWRDLRDDVRDFVSADEQQILELWDASYFLGHLESLMEYLQTPLISLSTLIAEEKSSNISQAVENALKIGALPNDHSRKGHRPLQIAIAKGYLDVARLLVMAGADLNYRDSSGLTPLQTAVNFGHFEFAQFLREKGGHFDLYAPNLAFDPIKLHHFKIISNLENS